MSNEQVIDGTATEVRQAAAEGAASKPARRLPRRTLVVGAIAAPLALGAVGLSLAQNGAPSTMPIAPVAISTLVPSGGIAAKGEVAEIFGNKFVLQDGTGRALVETGRQGEDGKLVAKGEIVTVQGRFENGFLHAAVLTHGDGNRVLLGPAGGPPPGTLDWAKDKVGLGPNPDVPALTASVQAAGYSDVRVTGRGPRHLEVAAKGQDGRERQLHVGFDGQIREKRVF
ncbi:DNA-binding protein [Methylobacterium sp. E-041]|uniref:DNA-binding protein n=1 Tax=Methylobacterium sp. E-041 TaxID=2836573 RepID=UPI001FBAECA2|nr:DNA-binding protein [Methylobacterium sp. E-041]MCJ2108751.1 DNA-binding protein [Methylobacterium sp. E-041]